MTDQPTPPDARLSKVDTLIEDMIAQAGSQPLLYALKRGGVIVPGLGLALDADDLMQGFLFWHRGVLKCTDPKCGCLGTAWDRHAKGVEVVQVRLSEVTE